MQKPTPFCAHIIAQRAQVLIEATIPLNLFLPFLFTTHKGKGMVPFTPCGSQNHHDGMWRPCESQALIDETEKLQSNEHKIIFLLLHFFAK